MNKSLKVNLLSGEGRGKCTIAFLSVLIWGVSSMYAADAGANALTSSAAGVAKYVPVMQKLCYVLAAIIAVVSAVIIYKRITFDEDANWRKFIALPVLACVFLSASATALPAFFGLDVTKDDGGWSFGSFGNSESIDVTNSSSNEGTAGESSENKAHEHNWSRSPCDVGGVLTYYCSCGESYTQVDEELRAAYVKQQEELAAQQKAQQEADEQAKRDAWLKEQEEKMLAEQNTKRYIPKSIGVETAPDGTTKAFIVAEDGVKIYTDNYDILCYGEQAQIGKAPDGTYKYYILDMNNNGEKIWGKTYRGFSGAEWNAKTALEKNIIFMPSGNYYVAYREIGGEYVKIGTSSIRISSASLPAGSPIRFESGDLSSAYTVFNGVKKPISLSTSGAVQKSITNSISYSSPGAKMGVNPSTGQYTWYVTANDGTKIYSTNQNGQNNYIPMSSNVALAPDGSYKFFVTADDGTRIWGNAVN